MTALIPARAPCLLLPKHPRETSRKALSPARRGFSLAALLTLGVLAQTADAASWSGTSTISPTLQPDPTRGSTLNDVAVNANGLTVAAWDQYTYNNGGGATVGAAVQSGGRWGTPFTISANTDSTGAPIGFAMTPRVAVGADGTMAVSWTYQANSSSQQQIQVSVKPAAATTWTPPYTLATFTPGGVSISRSVPIAIDTNGNVTAAWNVWNGTRNVVQTASLPKGGAWSAPHDVSDATHDGLYLSLAVNARGDAGVVYSLSPYTTYATGTAAYYVSRTGPDGVWSSPLQVSETIMSWVGYVTNPQVALDANGLATVIYMGNGLEATREVSAGSWTAHSPIIQTNISGASYMSPDLAVDNTGNAIVALSIFDPTVGVDRASVWVTQGDANGNWTSAQRITDPTVPVDAYATRVAVSPDGTLAMVGWIDHYHGTAQVAQLPGGSVGGGTTWNTTTIGRGTAFSSFQEVLSLDAGSGTVARAIWKSSAKSGTKILASSYR